MLIPVNDYVFIEEVEDTNAKAENGVLFEDDISREHLIIGRVFIDDGGDNYFYSNFQNGQEVVCDVVGARKYFHDGKHLYIVNKMSIFGVVKNTPMKTDVLKINRNETGGGEF